MQGQQRYQPHHRQQGQGRHFPPLLKLKRKYLNNNENDTVCLLDISRGLHVGGKNRIAPSMLVTDQPEPKSFNMISSIARFPCKGRPHRRTGCNLIWCLYSTCTSYPQILNFYYAAIELRGQDNVCKELVKYATLQGKAVYSNETP